MRKNVCITYHMSKENEVAETCITIPMDAAVADDVLSNQEHSRYVKEGSSSITSIKQILRRTGFSVRPSKFDLKNKTW